MDELQDRLARVGLDVLAEYGFALAGGYALQAHQLVDRMSEDVDISQTGSTPTSSTGRWRRSRMLTGDQASRYC